MSYLTQAQDPKRRAAALTGTLAVHVALGFALVTGLTIAGAAPIDDPWDPFTVTPDPEKKPPPPKPEQTETNTESVITSPLPPIDLQPLDPVEAVLPDRVVEQVVFIPRPDPIERPDPPRPAFAPRKARPSNDPNRWITNDDYPASPLRSEIEGIAGYRVVVGSNGRVSRCEITRPSGHDQLDGATCRYITQRARFDPATDETGAKVAGSFTGVVHWEIPD